MDDVDEPSENDEVKVVDLNRETRRNIPFALRKIAGEIESGENPAASGFLVTYDDDTETQTMYLSGEERSIYFWVGLLVDIQNTLLELGKSEEE